MRRVFEFSHNPKLLSGDDAIDVVGNKVVNLLVCHRADDNIVIVRNAMAAVDDEIQPCFLPLKVPTSYRTFAAESRSLFYLQCGLLCAGDKSVHHEIQISMRAWRSFMSTMRKVFCRYSGNIAMRYFLLCW